MSALLTLEQALERLLAQAAAEPLHVGEEVAAADALGRVLARPLVSGLDLPPWPNSAMDGYALRLADCSGEPLPVSQQVFAGQVPEPLAAGSCARIFTGAPLPPGADTVEMQENVEVQTDGRVRFLEPLRNGRNVRPQGQEVHAGETLLEAGTVVGPVEQGLIASIGLARIEVRRRPRVALLSTGDELVEPGLPLGAGQIYNSNRAFLAGALARLGCEVFDGGILRDDLESTRSRLAALGDADLILSTGGVSVGEADYLGQVLRDEGELTLWKLALKPGKPLTCGRYRGTPLIGLPGNPAATLVTFALLVRPYLLRRLGVERLEPLRFAVPAGFSWPKAGVRRELLRARLEQGRAVLYPNQSSGVLRSAAWADGLVEIREGTAPAEGDAVTFIPLGGLI